MSYNLIFFILETLWLSAQHERIQCLIFSQIFCCSALQELWGYFSAHTDVCCFMLSVDSPSSSALVEESSSSSWKKSIIVLLPGLLFHHNDCWVPVFVKRSLLHRLNFSLLAKVVALRGGGLGGLGRHWFLTSIAKYSQLASSTLMSLENPKWDRSFALDFEHRRQHENVPS